MSDKTCTPASGGHLWWCDLPRLPIRSIVAVILLAVFMSRLGQPDFSLLENIFLVSSQLLDTFCTPYYYSLHPKDAPEARRLFSMKMNYFVFWDRQELAAKVTYSFKPYASLPFSLVTSPTGSSGSGIKLDYRAIFLQRELLPPSDHASVIHTADKRLLHLTPDHPSSVETPILEGANTDSRSSHGVAPSAIFPSFNMTLYLTNSAFDNNLHSMKLFFDRLTSDSVKTEHNEQLLDVVIEYQFKKLINMHLDTKLHNIKASEYRENEDELEKDGNVFDETKASKSLHPIFVFLHGGGWVFSDHRSYDKLLRRHANLMKKGSIVIALDYRLAPEFPYPTGLEDILYLLNWLYENGSRLGLDASQIVIAGDSAGGNLAAVVMCEGLARPEQFPWVKSVKAVGLIYPSICRDCASVSSIMYGSLFSVNLKSNQWFDLQYSRHVGEDLGWHATPFFAPDNLLKQFPPTYFVLFSHDIFYDAGILFHEKLRRLGVFTGLFTAPGLHGFYGCDFWCRYGVESVEWLCSRMNDRIA